VRELGSSWRHGVTLTVRPPVQACTRALTTILHFHRPGAPCPQTPGPPPPPATLERRRLGCVCSLWRSCEAIGAVQLQGAAVGRVQLQGAAGAVLKVAAPTSRRAAGAPRRAAGSWRVLCSVGRGLPRCDRGAEYRCAMPFPVSGWSLHIHM
jgi:hypothetical protein